MYGCQSPEYASNALTNTRSNPAKPAAFTPDAMYTTVGLGAPWYTSGVHEWNGTAAILNPKPTSSRANPARSSAVGLLAVSDATTSPPDVRVTRLPPRIVLRLVEPVAP